MRSAAPVTQNRLSKPEDLLQNAPPPRKSAPWPPNVSDGHVSWTAPATHNASLQVQFKRPKPAIVFWQGAESIATATENDAWTSKSGPNMWCLHHFDLEICFAPLRRALFLHLNLQKQSGAEAFLTFWLRSSFCWFFLFSDCSHLCCCICP